MRMATLGEKLQFLNCLRAVITHGVFPAGTFSRLTDPTRLQQVLGGLAVVGVNPHAGDISPIHNARYPQGYGVKSREDQEQSYRDLFPEGGSCFDSSMNWAPPHFMLERSGLGDPSWTGKQNCPVVIFPKLGALAKCFNISGDPYGDGYNELYWKMADRCERYIHPWLFVPPPYKGGVVGISDQYAKRLKEVEDCKGRNATGDLFESPISLGQMYCGWSSEALEWEALENPIYKKEKRRDVPMCGVHILWALAIGTQNRFSQHFNFKLRDLPLTASVDRISYQTEAGIRYHMPIQFRRTQEGILVASVPSCESGIQSCPAVFVRP